MDIDIQDGCIYVYGGWNHDTTFNDIFMLDVENKDSVFNVW